MLLIGLTGSIATGKSTVSSILSSSPHNLPVVDADKIARQVVEPGTRAYKQIVSAFAASTPDLLHADQPNRPLNRAALGRRVFAPGRDADRARLNAIVHPAVRREMLKQVASAYVRGCWGCVLDVPLLFESGWEPLCGSIVVVAVREPTTQMARLQARDPHLSAEEARDRVAAQWDVRDKAARCEKRRGEAAGVVLWNDGGQEELKRQVDEAVARLERASPRWWGRVLLLCPPLALAAALWNVVRTWYAGRSRPKEKAKL